MPKPFTNLRPQAQWLTVIGEENRLVILQALATGGKTVVELSELIGKRDLASHHLRHLRRVGLVKMEREGTTLRYVLVGATVTTDAIRLKHPSGITVIVSRAGSVA